MTDRITKIDKSRNPFQIGIGCAEDFSQLLEMYRVFYPKPASQGLPPEDSETCFNWVKHLFEMSENLLAWRGDPVIGHAAVVPDLKHTSGEFVIFVDQNHRNVGVGTELTLLALEVSRRAGLNSIWLTVDMSNSVAVKLYKKLGFEYSDQDIFERVMCNKLS